MSRSILYLFIYSFTLCFFAKPIDRLMSFSAGYALLLLVAWVAISSAIVHVIHFWPSRAS